jgi:hypothetical protein
MISQGRDESDDDQEDHDDPVAQSPSGHPVKPWGGRGIAITTA